jgi:hypothetical protein
MDPLYFLIGALVFFALLFFSFIVFLWGLKQLLTIKNQNDIIISFLQQASVTLWNEGHIQARLQEDIGDDMHPGARVRAA